MANNPSRTPLAFGFNPGSPNNSTSTTAINAGPATLRVAVSFQGNGKTINGFRANFSAVAGTLAAGDISCSIFSDSSGSPNASLGSTTTSSPATVAAGWVEWSGLSVVTSIGSQYWVVIDNNNGTPGTNNATIRLGGSSTCPNDSVGTSSFQGGIKRQYNGTNWTTVGAVAGMGGFAVLYSDSTREGLPVSTIATASNKVYAGRKHGPEFTTPATWPTLKVTGAKFFIASAGSPTGNPQVEIYQGTTSLGTSTAVPKANITSSGVWVVFAFTSAISLSPGTAYRVVLSETAQADGSGNNYNHTNVYTWDTDSTSQSQLLPIGGTLKEAYFDGTSWTSTTGIAIPFTIILDSVGGEFSTPGLIYLAGMQGGMLG